MTHTEAAQVLSIARPTVTRWVLEYQRGGAKALKAKRRSRLPASRLAPHAAALVVRLILGRCPDQLRLPFALWTREAVQRLLEARCGLQVSVWTVGRYFKR
jgi:transposase